MGVGGARGDYSREDIEFLALAQMYGWDGAVGRDEALVRRGRDVGGGLCGLFGRPHLHCWNVGIGCISRL